MACMPLRIDLVLRVTRDLRQASLAMQLGLQQPVDLAKQMLSLPLHRQGRTKRR